MGGVDGLQLDQVGDAAGDLWKRGRKRGKKKKNNIKKSNNKEAGVAVRNSESSWACLCIRIGFGSLYIMDSRQSLDHCLVACRVRNLRQIHTGTIVIAAVDPIYRLVVRMRWCHQRELDEVPCCHRDVFQAVGRSQVQHQGAGALVNQAFVFLEKEER